MFSAEHESTIRELVAELGLKVKIILEEGLVEHYNRIEFFQMKDYIKVN